MPTVPGVPDNQVRLNPLAGERFQAPDIGEGGRRIGKAMEGFGAAIGKVAQDVDDINAIHDEASAKTLDVQYQQYERERLLGEDGYYTKRSGDAIASRSVIEEDLAKKRAELLAATGSKRARAMLETVLSRRGEEASNGIARHYIEQNRAFNVEAIGSRLDMAQENYATYLDSDPERAQAERDTFDSEFARLADMEGWNDPAILSAKKEEFLTKFHQSYIEAEAQRDPAKAAAYLEKHRGEISHGVEIGLDKTLRPLLVDSDAEAVAAMAGDNGTTLPVISNVEGDAPGNTTVAGSSREVFRAMVGDNRAGPGRARGAEGGTDTRTGRFLTSPAGAIGPAQVMPGTAREMAAHLGIAWDEKRYKSDFDYNMKLGEAYFNKMLRTFHGDVAKAVAAYNAGPGGVNRAVRRGGANWRGHLPAETKKYLVNVLGTGTSGAAVAPRGRDQARSSEQAEIEWIETYVPEKFADKPPLYVKQVMEEAKAKVREKWQNHRAEENAAEAEQWDAAQEAAAQVGGWGNITSTKQIPNFTDLPADKQNSVFATIETNQRQAASGTKIETNWEDYASYKAMTPSQLAKVPLQTLRDNLSDTEFKEIIGKRTGKVDEGSAVTHKSILTASGSLLMGAGLSLTGLKGKQLERVRAERSEFLGDMTSWADSYHRAHGKWPTDREVQDKADLLLLKVYWHEDGKLVEGRYYNAPEDKMGADTPRSERVQVVVPADIRARILAKRPGASAGEIHQLYVAGKKRGAW